MKEISLKGNCIVCIYNAQLDPVKVACHFAKLALLSRGFFRPEDSRCQLSEILLRDRILIGIEMGEKLPPVLALMLLLPKLRRIGRWRG